MTELNRTQDITISTLRANPETALKLTATKVSLRITSHGRPKGYLINAEDYDAFRHRLAELERQFASIKE